MENKNNVILFSIIFFLLGILIGSFFCANKKMGGEIPNNMHMMPGGHMMQNDMMSMGDMMDGMMSNLKGKTGNEFDQAFLSEMIVHHEGAVLMAEAVLENSKRPELIKLADDIIKAQTKEIEMMKSWQKNW